MSIKLGATSIGSLYLGSTKIGAAYLGNVKLYQSADPYNPLGLPPYTIRLEMAPGWTPHASQSSSWAQVSATPNVWDFTNNNSYWGYTFTNNTNVISVVGFNSTSITIMAYTFSGCSNITSVCLFDTSRVTSAIHLFDSCTSLMSIPLFNTSSMVSMDSAFYACLSVSSGALALYTQASTQARPPSSHTDTFAYCGYSNPAGQQELAQIPASWGGTGA